MNNKFNYKPNINLVIMDILHQIFGIKLVDFWEINSAI